MKLPAPKGHNFLPSLVVSVLLSSLLFFVVVQKLRACEIEAAALLVIAAFTFMLTVSGFLYTRVQAWPEGRIKRRSLYAAEHCLGGSTFFGLQILGAAIAFYIFRAARLARTNELGYFDIGLIFGLFIANSFRASFNFFYGIRVAIHTKPWTSSPKGFLRSLRTMR